jgi:hypothetical protein
VTIKWIARRTSMLGKLLEDLIGRFLAFLKLSGFIKAEELFEQSGLLGWQSSFGRNTRLRRHELLLVRTEA